MAVSTAAQAASSRYSHTTCRGWIAGMWALYLVSLVLSLTSRGMMPFGFALATSACSFGMAIWLIFQPNEFGKVHGGIKLLWDMGVAIVVACLALHSGLIADALHQLSH